MDRETRRRLEDYRRDEAGPIENNLIDEFVGGTISRRQLLRRGAILGLSLPTLAAVLAGCGGGGGGAGATTGGTSTVPGKIGGRVRVGIIPPPSAAIEPSQFNDQGGLSTGSICGEFLTRGGAERLRPELAISWKPNADATVWTFKLRPDVKFQTGQTMTADDVVATWRRLASPGSQALSVVGDYLSPDGVVKVDDLTVAFRLQSPVSNFPFLVGSDTYQSIILPANYKLGTFTSKPQCTGAFMLTSYKPGVGATYERFADWWGGRAPLDGVDVTYYSEAAASDAALLGGQIDLIGQVQLSTDRPLFTNPDIQIFEARAASHRQVPMRVDMDNAFRDARVRQAVALTLDRPAIIETLFQGRAELGNDSPFAPIYGLATNAPQRAQDIPKAKELMAAAGYSNGFPITLTTQKTQELPQLAQIIQDAVKAIGIDMKLSILSVTTYYSSGTQTGPPEGWGTTPWLNTPMNITDWGGRPVPNVFLTSGLSTKGVWNAAHYSNKSFDAAVKSFLAAAEFAEQDKYATQMQEILLEDTPIIVPYFFYFLAAGRKNVQNYHATPDLHIYLSNTWLS